MVNLPRVRPPFEASLHHARIVNYEDWLNIGVNANYCSEPYCSIHEIGVLTNKEAELFDDGDASFCVSAVRLLPPSA